MSEGKEPPCFLQLFQGGLIIHKGSREDSANNTGKKQNMHCNTADLCRGFGSNTLSTYQMVRHKGRPLMATALILNTKHSNRVVLLSPGGWRLFCVRGEAEVEASLVEVDCQRASLRSRASLVLLNAQKGLLYLWHGCKAHATARQVAKRAVDKVTQR